MAYISLRVKYIYRAHSSFVPSQWETSLQSNTVSRWLGANLESGLIYDKRADVLPMQEQDCYYLRLLADVSLREQWRSSRIGSDSKEDYAGLGSSLSSVYLFHVIGGRILYFWALPSRVSNQNIRCSYASGTTVNNVVHPFTSVNNPSLFEIMVCRLSVPSHLEQCWLIVH